MLFYLISMYTELFLPTFPPPSLFFSISPPPQSDFHASQVCVCVCLKKHLGSIHFFYFPSFCV